MIKKKIQKVSTSLSSWFFENEPYEKNLSVKGRYFAPYKLKSYTNKAKEKKKERKGGEEKKSNGCTLSFYHGYFDNKKTVRRKRSIWR